MAKADHIEARARFSGPDAGPSEVTATPGEIGRDEVAVDDADALLSQGAQPQAVPAR